MWNECGQSLSSEEEGEGREGESRGVEWSGGGSGGVVCVRERVSSVEMRTMPRARGRGPRRTADARG